MAQDDTADAIGRARAAALGADARRRAGAVFTPVDLAQRLVAWATEGWDAPGPWRVLDPACGAGAFLVAATRHQPQVELHGWDLDPVSLAAARAVVPTADLRERDGLAAWDGAPFDLVVGNPPFLGQLRSDTTRSAADRRRLVERFGAAASGYVDAAAVFLLAALDVIRPGGRVVLVQPESVLGTAHTATVRREVLARADLVGLWVADAHLFDASVDTCAVVLERGGRPRPVRLASGRDVGPIGTTRAPVEGDPSWSPLLARARDVPEVVLDAHAGTVGDLATATAGFRQHHYALVPHLLDLAPGRSESGDPAARNGEDLDVRPQEREGTAGEEIRAVVTTGMVDPLELGWGLRSARIGGRRWQRPAVDLAAVAVDDPAVADWFRARLRPKVLVAPQTRIVEAAVDPHGTCLPATPLVSVEPLDAGADAAWLLGAALSAPPVAAWALDRTAGTARSRHALKLSARQVLEVPLPIDVALWRTVAADLRAGRPLADAAPDLTRMYGVAPDHPVVAWWVGRRPSTRRGDRGDGGVR